MMKHTSNFIFSLAEKYQILLNNSESEFPDENYFGFCKEYLELCKARDIELKKHLLNKPNLFRTFLPYRPYIFDTVLQTQWYYDELVIYDPIFFEISLFKTNDIEKDKAQLKGLLAFLHPLKNSVVEGFLLFGSYDNFATSSETIKQNRYDELLDIPELREECDQLVQVYKMESQEGIDKSYYNVRAIYKDKQVLFVVVNDFEKIRTETGYGVYYDLTGANYKPLTVQEAKNAGIYDRAYDSFKDEYFSEITDILDYINIGSNINTPVLFDRKLDELVLSNISSDRRINKSRANDYYKLFLPFIDGIPSERLFDVRAKMPTAFLDFRAQMFEIIHDLEKSDVESDILELKIQQRINPLLRKLEAEMKNSLIKSKIIGAGIPIASGIGALGLWHWGIDVSKYTSLLLGGLPIAELGVLANYLTERNSGRASPVYYLWSAKQSGLR